MVVASYSSDKAKIRLSRKSFILEIAVRTYGIYNAPQKTPVRSPILADFHASLAVIPWRLKRSSRGFPPFLPNKLST